MLVGLTESGVNPEALAAVVKELRRESADARVIIRHCRRAPREPLPQQRPPPLCRRGHEFYRMYISQSIINPSSGGTVSPNNSSRALSKCAAFTTMAGTGVAASVSSAVFAADTMPFLVRSAAHSRIDAESAAAHSAYKSAPLSFVGSFSVIALKSTSAPSANFRVSARGGRPPAALSSPAAPP